MIRKDFIKIFFSVIKIFVAITAVVVVGANGFLFTQAYFALSITGTSLPSQTGYWGPPSVILLSPNGGGSLYQGNNYSINWNATAAFPSGDPVVINLYYSTDGGATYPNTIATTEANDGIYNWVVPNIFSNTVKVKVVAVDAHTLSASDESNANFSIVSPIVLNEFLPNPFGADEAAKPFGEWVELRNNGSVAVDANNWVLYDNDDANELIVSSTNSDDNGNPADAGETIVPAGGFLVVYRNGDGDFELNNSGGDGIRLYNAEILSGGVLIDSYTYAGDAPENKSYARIPDGFGAFVDPIPTPGQPNILEEASNETSSTPAPESFTVEGDLKIEEIPLPTPDVFSTPSAEPTLAPTVDPSPSSLPLPTNDPTPTAEPSLMPTPSPIPTPLETPMSFLRKDNNNA